MFTKNELSLLAEAVAQQINSAKRQQNSKRGTPQIHEVYKKHEQIYQALLLKINDLEEKAS